MRRKLEKLESVARSSHEAPPTEPHGYAAKYLRDLIAKAECGELSKVKPATDEKKSEARLEIETMVAKVANRIRRAPKPPVATVQPGGAHGEAQPTGADNELPEELLARLLCKVGLTSNKVH